jgi:hypothetical protein
MSNIYFRNGYQIAQSLGREIEYRQNKNAFDAEVAADRIRYDKAKIVHEDKLRRWEGMKLMQVNRRLIQWKPLNVITLEQRESDNIFDITVFFFNLSFSHSPSTSKQMKSLIFGWLAIPIFYRPLAL